GTHARHRAGIAGALSHPACGQPSHPSALRHGALHSCARRTVDLDMGNSLPVNTTAIARNAPCPCGSGRRYKDCHGSLQAGRPPPATADALLSEAQVAFAAGHGATALELIR